jgi:hypothetical protein
MNARHKKGGRSRPDRNSQPDPAGPFAASSQQFAANSQAREESNPESTYSGDSGQRREHGKLAQDTLETARGLGQSVAAQAANIASHIGQELSATAEANVASGANALRGFAKAMETAAQELDSQSPQAARHVRDAAGRVESFSDSLSNRKVGDLLTAASDFARNKPAVFIAGAMLSGFAFARFLKSSGATTTPVASGEQDHALAAGDNPNAASSANAELT